MPIDPFFGTLIASALGFGGGLLGGDDDPTQKRRSFTESPATDPRQMLAANNKNADSVLKALVERARQPTQIKSRAVSSVGRPSSIDPATLASPGLNIGQLFGERLPQAPVVPTEVNPDAPSITRRRPRSRRGDE
jgi:hypothetical protein